MAVEQYDCLVIGSGQGGNPLALALAGAGWHVAMVESKHVAGTCINEGCTPTKTMVASARVAYLARRTADYGVRTGPVSVDLALKATYPPIFGPTAPSPSESYGTASYNTVHKAAR